MKTIGEFNSSKWGKVSAQQGTYGGPTGPVAVVLMLEGGEPLATLSVNMYRPECSQDSRDLPPNCFYAKDWGGNETFTEDALASGLFIEREDLPEALSGYVAAPVWQIAQVPS